MFVKLINHTPDPERTVAAAARLCYSSIGAAELFTSLKDADVARLL
ncbi:MAG: thymidylate synthase, partial [Bacillota bacterium]|nr:thymidylate synthase [Bacillota bacterium]